MPHSSGFYAPTFDADGLEADSSSLESGQLYLWFPVGVAERRVRQHLRQSGRVFRFTPTGAMRIEAPDGSSSALIAELGAILPSDESADTRCVFKSGSEELNGDDIVRVRTLDQLSGALAV